jgi:hypothetical protein
MESMARGFFMNLYQGDQDVCPYEVIHLFQPMITDAMNEELCRTFSDEEIGDTLFQMGPLKAPELDVFPARFYQCNWEALLANISKGVRSFFDSWVMPEGINDIVIILILEKEEPELLKDFRPISLCNVIYKIISKCMVNRLQPLFGDLIADTQSAFIPGRLIMDNALIAFECLHALKHGSKKSKEFDVYKLDLTKAYDRVDWSFLEGVLKHLGFHCKWV